MSHSSINTTFFAIYKSNLCVKCYYILIILVFSVSIKRFKNIHVLKKFDLNTGNISFFSLCHNVKYYNPKFTLKNLPLKLYTL